MTESQTQGTRAQLNLSIFRRVHLVSNENIRNKKRLTTLQTFLDPELSFSFYFRTKFCMNIGWGSQWRPETDRALWSRGVSGPWWRGCWRRRDWWSGCQTYRSRSEEAYVPRQLPSPGPPLTLHVLHIKQQQWGHDQSEVLQVTSTWNSDIRTKKAWVWLCSTPTPRNVTSSRTRSSSSLSARRTASPWSRWVTSDQSEASILCPVTANKNS